MGTKVTMAPLIGWPSKVTTPETGAPAGPVSPPQPTSEILNTTAKNQTRRDIANPCENKRKMCETKHRAAAHERAAAA
jgi:hypothetical protein